MGHRKNSGKRKKLTPNTFISKRKSFKTIIQAFTSRPQRKKNKSTTKKRIEINNIAFRKTEIINETRI